MAIDLEKKEVRLFVAAEVPDSFKKQIVHAQSHLQHRQICHATYPHVDALHLTLAFLGNVSTEQVPTIQDALRAVQQPTVQLTLDGLDFFGPQKSPHVLFMHVEGPGLVQLVHTIQAALFHWLQPSEREFVGHLTIARIKRLDDHDALEHFLMTFKSKPQSSVLTEFVLLQSELTADGPRYTEIERYSLKSV